MLNKVKHGIREKIVSSTKEGNAEISDAINVLQASVRDLSNSVEELKKDVKRLSADYTFVSAEYLPINTPSNKKRLLICGFYGAKNLGDELMLQSLLAKIDRNKFDITIMVARHIENDTSSYSPYKVIHYPKKNDDILNIVHNYDVLVWGGGAILDDSNYRFDGARTPLGYIFLKSSIAMINAEKPVFIFGVSTNQHLEDARFISDLQFVVNGANYFSLRDENSKETMEEAKIDTAKVAIIDDLAISGLPIVPERKKISAGQLEVGVILINSWDHITEFSEFVHNIAAAVPDRKVKLRFIPFYDYIDLDVDGYNKVAKAAGIEAVVTAYPENVEGLAKELLACDVVFSMRYHGALISSLLNVNTVAIDISKKHVHYYNKINYIKEHYNGALLNLPVEEVGDAEKVSAVMNAALKNQAPVESKKIIESAKKELSALTRKLFGSI